MYDARHPQGRPSIRDRRPQGWRSLHRVFSDETLGRARANARKARTKLRALNASLENAQGWISPVARLKRTREMRIQKADTQKRSPSRAQHRDEKGWRSRPKCARGAGQGAREERRARRRGSTRRAGRKSKGSGRGARRVANGSIRARAFGDYPTRYG